MEPRATRKNGVEGDGAKSIIRRFLSAVRESVDVVLYVFGITELVAWLAPKGGPSAQFDDLHAQSSRAVSNRSNGSESAIKSELLAHRLIADMGECGWG